MSNTQPKLSKNAQSLLDVLAQPGHYLYVKVVKKFAGVREDFYLLKITGEIPNESERSKRNGQIHLATEQFAEAERTLVHPRIAIAVRDHPDMSQRGFVLDSQNPEEPVDFFWFLFDTPAPDTQSHRA